MKFSISLPQGWVMDLAHINDPSEAYEGMTRVAQTADETGYEGVWLVDHFHTIPKPSQEVTFECWTTTAALARDTKKCKVGQMVTCNNYRNPALLAKMASTVDVLSRGRLICGIGAGWYEHEYRAYGYDFPDGPERLRQLREAVQIILKMWKDDEATFEGQHYQVKGAINQPKGIQKPHIPLLIGGGGEKVTLKLVAEYAQACNISGDVDTVRHKLGVLKEHCQNLGRPYDEVHRTGLTFCSFAKTDEEAHAQIPASLHELPFIKTGLIGGPETLQKRFAEYAEAGVQEMILAFPDSLKLDPLKRFADTFF